MPPVVAAISIIADEIGAGIIAAGAEVGIAGPTFFTIATNAAWAIVGTGVSMLIDGVTSLMDGLVSGAHQPSGLIVSTSNPKAPWRVVYGQTRLAGVVTFMTTTGSNNEYLHVVLTLCKGKIQSIDTLYFNGAAIPLDGSGNGLGKWSGLVHAEYDLGDPNNTSQPFPGLASSCPGYWNSTCLQRGHAKAYVRLKWDTTQFTNGIPNLSFDIHGREVYDPRSGTTAWSNNAALCLRDYLTDQTIGLMADAATEINDASFTAAANTCDETVALKGTVVTATVGNNTGDGGTGYVTGDLVQVNGGNGDCALWVAQTDASGKVQRLNVSDPGSGYSTGNEILTIGGTGHSLIVNITTHSGSEAQYLANGAFEVTTTPGQVINDFSLAMAGYTTYVQGEFQALPGAWVTPTVTLTDDDFRAPLIYQPRYSLRDIFNAVHGTYLSEANGWQPSDYPAMLDGTAIDEDGSILWNQIDLPFTTSASAAQRIAKIQLERCRRQGTATAHCKLTAGMVQPGDVIRINHARTNWTGKTFFVTDVGFVSDSDANGAPALGVDLLLQETDANIYSWTSADEQPARGPALAPVPDNGIVAPPTSVTATAGEAEAAIGADGIITNRILVQWTAPADYFVQNGGKIVIEHRLSSGPGPWLPAIYADGAATQAYIAPVSGNTNYDIAIWAINASGASSPIVEVLAVNTNELVSTFTGESGTVSTLANFTTADLAESSGLYYAGQHGADVTADNQSASTASLIGHTQDDLPDGTGRFAASRYFSGFQGGSGVQRWAKIGTWIANNTGGNALRLEFSAGGGYASAGYQQSFAGIIARIGNNTAAPNLSGLSWQETQTQSQALVNLKAVATGGSTAPGNLSWDIYVEYSPFAIGMWEAIYSAGASFTWADTLASDPGAGSSTVVIGQGGPVTSGDGHIVGRVRKYDPGSVLRDMFLNGYHTADNVDPGVLTEIMTIARQNAGLDSAGNLLFKNIKRESIPSGQSLGTTTTPLNNTLSITTHGKPVFLLAIVTFSNSLTGNMGMQPYFYRDGTPLTGTANFGGFTIPPNATDTKLFFWPDITPAAGAHTYQIQGFAAPSSLAVLGGTFFAWEFA